MCELPEAPRFSLTLVARSDSFSSDDLEPGTTLKTDLKTRLRHDLDQARKNRDRLRTLVLSTTLSEVRNREIELGKEAADDDVVGVISKAIKQRRDASDQARSAGREDLADKEATEAEMLAAYLPEQLAEDEVRAMIRDAIADGADQLGPLMGRIMPRLRGRFDGKEANRIAREELER